MNTFNELGEALASLDGALSKLRLVEQKVQSNKMISESGSAYEYISEMRDKIKHYCSKDLLPIFRENAFLVEETIQVLAKIYSEDISDIGFAKTPFALAFRNDIRRRFLRRSWHSVFFPVLLSTPSLNVYIVAKWLAENISKNKPELIRTNNELRELVQSIDDDENNISVVLTEFRNFSENSLCYIEKECRSKKIILVAAQENNVHRQDDKFNGVEGWTSKLTDRYRPRFVPQEEIERQTLWRDANTSSIAKTSILKEWILDPHIWAKGKLPISEILARLPED